MAGGICAMDLLVVRAQEDASAPVNLTMGDSPAVVISPHGPGSGDLPA
jgi:hypothetical protein